MGMVGQLRRLSFVDDDEDMFRIVLLLLLLLLLLLQVLREDSGGDLWLRLELMRKKGVIERNDAADDILGEELARSAVSCSILIGNINY
mmetsp:Transcript_7639/g.11638  ORF Transcript_7639/g.11638 Transcript_7639/m.11638 type:complete len:89 (+) Transcript_7639:1093-1359(+)